MRSIVRLGDQVDKAVINAACGWKIIGRAGITIDNIDVEGASEAGVIVCNAPTSNTVSRRSTPWASSFQPPAASPGERLDGRGE